MSATSSSGDLLVDQIAEEFMQKLRRGEQPKISEYTQRYPKIAGQLKSQLKFLQMLEQAGSNSRRMQPLVQEIQTLTPDLKILEFIGSGGMGSVWKARQLSLERTVAIKVLHQQMFDWELSRERFLEEARIASNLTHEHIVPVHDVFPRAAQPYYLMQFIEGCPLSLIIEAWKRQRDGEQASDAAPTSAPSQPATTAPRRPQSCSTIPERSFRKIAAWMQQAATAVHFAHQNNVLHRDLKPSNFLIDDTQKIWLTDFGLAKRPQHNSLSVPGQAPGTLRYMSPEQCDGRATTLSDVYSLGVTLYEMLALTPAFHQHSARSLPQQIRAGSCPHLRSHDPAIPRDLVVITRKAMAVLPEDRYESAKAMAVDLQRFLEGKPILARPMSAPEMLWRLINRHKLVSAVTTLAAILLVATSSIAIYSSYLREIGLESEIGKQLAEASEIAKSQLPEQQTLALKKIANAVGLAEQTPDPTESKSRIRDSIATILGTPEMVLPQPLPHIDKSSLYPFVVARNRTRIVVQAPDKTLEVRDGSDGSLQAQITLGVSPFDFEISADGCCLLVSSPDPDTKPAGSDPATAPVPQLDCWDLTSGQPALRWTIPGLQATAITFLPNHQQCVTADSDGSIHRIELSTGRRLQSYPCTGPVTNIVLRPHPDKEQPIVAVCCVNYHEIQFLNLHSGQVVRHIPRSGVSGFDWHPDGHLLALHDELLEVELLHWPSLRPHKTIHKGIGLTHCRFSPDGRWLAAGTWSSTGHQTQLIAIRIEDQYTLTCPWPYIPDGKSLLWSENSTELATLYHGEKIFQAQLKDPQLFQHFDDAGPWLPVAPSVAPAKNLPLIVANVLGVPGLVLNLQTGTTLTAPLPDRRNSCLPYVSSVAWNTDKLVSLDFFARKLWNIQPHFTQQGDLRLNTKSRIRLPLSQASLQLTQDGSRVFFNSPAGRLLYFPTDDPFALRSLPSKLTVLKVPSRTGRLVFCDRKDDSVLYDCDLDQIVAVFLSNSDAIFSPDERFLLVSFDAQNEQSASGSSRFLYDISSRRITHSLPPGPAYCSFSDSGELLAARFVSEQCIRLIQTSDGTTLLRLPIEADNRGRPHFADNDRRLFIESPGQTSNRFYSIDLQALMAQYSDLKLPVPVLLPAPNTAAGGPPARLLTRAQAARTLTFSSATTPLHRQFIAALCKSLWDLTRNSPAPKNHFAPLLTSLCCDALELGCLDVASLTLGWQQLLGTPSAGVTAIRASLLLRQNQPAQALQLLQTPLNAADCDMTLQFNRCVALQLLDRPAEARTEFARIQPANAYTAQLPMLTLLNSQLPSTEAAQQNTLSLEEYLVTIPRLLIQTHDFRSHQLALFSAQQLTRQWPAVADGWEVRALAEICNGLPAEATSSLAQARQLKQNRNDATLQLVESAIHLHNEDFPAWFAGLLKTNQLLDQQVTGFTPLHSAGRDMPLAITLQVPVRANSLSGRLYRWLLLAESQFLGHTHIDVLLKTRTGM